ncbi:SWIM zinc finger family protein [Planotetraspora sp. A-T 1434]|uniref:SWIM zinc finger family protein n=1 Tax=Planotetraspora sp. A-T 1434 TaxID=2979219 RepID=UPI0021C1EED3|nr:SWIM zinc finger family protein [Planotetraspora sp. A-T 1434]MCT9929323.1 SWIM zinc finger family protein [Planotetraspora sp. A-T 1434]
MDGLKARGRRGTMGERWWSRRFIDILESICDKGRLSRGRSYARAGNVLDLDIAPGLVRSRVQGSRPEPYDVVIEIAAYGAADWERLTEALGAQALYRAKLLAGEMPREIEDVFSECGLPLFPSSNQQDDEQGLEMECSCPDWGFPCKHLSAVLYLLAERFDDDPFLVLAWRGMAKETLLDDLREVPGQNTEDVPFAERLADFYEPGTSLARLRSQTSQAPAPPELLLRTLDPPPIRVRHIPILDLLRPAYRRLGDAQNLTDPGTLTDSGSLTDPRSAGEPSP